MTQVRADVEALEELARLMAEFAASTADSLGRTQGKLQEIGADRWQDEKCQEIEARFAESRRMLELALRVLGNEQRQHLLGLARHARAWLGASA